MSVINTNYLSLVAQNNLQKSQSALGSAIERLSSGLRINSAKDDAAGQAIANRMSSQIRGLAQAQRNANDGISVAQTAEGALNEVNTNLQRIRELAVQSLNDTYTAEDRASLQAEIKQRLSEIDRISEQTDFNGVKVLAEDRTLNIQVGANDGEVIEIGLEEITSDTLNLSSFNVNGPVGSLATAGAADFQDAFGDTTQVAGSSVAEGSANALAARLGISSASVVLGTSDALVDDAGNWYAQVTITAANTAETNALNALGLSSGTFYIALEPSTANTATPTNAAFTIDTNSLSLSALTTGATSNPLEALDNALKQVDELRSDLGAIQNRFETAITNLQTNATNLTAARSRIEDADYAVEVANMTRSQILQQAGTSVLSQANQIPQGVLSLLR
jgi:flagellin